jgi:glycosyltransferase involved in cell wall biosynthesis
VNTPEISVVMSVYNGASYLDEAIQSVLNQTHSDFEFIIIDDGSTDESSQIIENYWKSDERLIVITQDNRGLVYSLNKGIQKARGKYIARMDADDISLPQRFERQISLMKSENVDICGCHVFTIDETGNYISAKIFYTSVLLNKFVLCRTVPFAHGSVMFKKDFMLSNELSYGQTKYNKAEDYALWIQFSKLGAKISNVDDFLFKYRDVQDSLSKKSINSRHAYSLSDDYCGANMKILNNKLNIALIADSFNKLKAIERENISYFLIKSVLAGNFSNLGFLRYFPKLLNITNFLKIVSGK